MSGHGVFACVLSLLAHSALSLAVKTVSFGGHLRKEHATVHQLPPMATLATQVDTTLYNGALVNADIWAPTPYIMARGIEFLDTIGVPGDALGLVNRSTAERFGAQWNDQAQCYDDSEAPVYTDASAANPVITILGGWGETCDLRAYGGLPVCFSWPVSGRPVGADFQITVSNVNTGEVVWTARSTCATLAPNFELNERHCIVNALPGMATRDGVQRVTKVEVVGNQNGWKLIGPNQQTVNPVGLALDARASPYMPCGGVEYFGAKLNKLTNRLGEGVGMFSWNPAAGAARSNDGISVFGFQQRKMYRLRVYYSGGQTPNGVNGLTPNMFEEYFFLVLKNGQRVREVGKEVYGITVLGLADLGSPRPICRAYNDECYWEDRDNYIDIIFTAQNDKKAAEVLRVEHKGGLFNPGGPGIYPLPGINYTYASSKASIEVVNDLDGRWQVSYCGGQFQPALVCHVMAGNFTSPLPPAGPSNCPKGVSLAPVNDAFNSGGCEKQNVTALL